MPLKYCPICGADLYMGRCPRCEEEEMREQERQAIREAERQLEEESLKPTE